MHITSTFGLLVQSGPAQTIAGGCRHPSQRQHAAAPVLPVLAVWVRLACRRLLNS